MLNVTFNVILAWKRGLIARPGRLVLLKQAYQHVQFTTCSFCKHLAGCLMRWRKIWGDSFGLLQIELMGIMPSRLELNMQTPEAYHHKT
jgi:hypothetical protein